MPKIKDVFWEGFPERKTPKIRVKTPQISTGPKKFVFMVCVFFHLCKNALTGEIQKDFNLLFLSALKANPDWSQCLRLWEKENISDKNKVSQEKQTQLSLGSVYKQILEQTNPEIETTPSVVKAIIILPVQMRMVGTGLAIMVKCNVRTFPDSHNYNVGRQLDIYIEDWCFAEKLHWLELPLSRSLCRPSIASWAIQLPAGQLCNYTLWPNQ